jgi:hypothetical protein
VIEVALRPWADGDLGLLRLTLGDPELTSQGDLGNRLAAQQVLDVARLEQLLGEDVVDHVVRLGAQRGRLRQEAQ